MTACRFCGNPAVASFALPEGCFCYPDDREQSLCPQHIVSAEPRGKMTLKEVLDAKGWERFKETRR